MIKLSNIAMVSRAERREAAIVARTVRPAFRAARACAVMLLLVGPGLVPSVAVALEVARNGTLINQQCGAERTGCGWCTVNSCYKVTSCNDTKCTVARQPGPQQMDAKRGTGPVLHGGYTNPTGPTLPTTVVHRQH
jgi:hypothetical protein